MPPFQYDHGHGLPSHYVLSDFLFGTFHLPTVVNHDSPSPTTPKSVAANGHPAAHGPTQNSHLVNQNHVNGSHSSILGSGSTTVDSLGESSGTGIGTLLILCTLLLPFVIGIGAILSVALLIRRMRRAQSLKEVTGEAGGIVSFDAYPSPSVAVLSSSSNNRGAYPSISQVLGIEPYDPGSDSSSSTEETYHGVVDHDHIKSLSQGKSDDTVAANGSSSKRQKLKRSISMKSLSMKGIGSRFIRVLTFPKRMRQQAAEKKRFNIYSISGETREQLKQIYVY